MTTSIAFRSRLPGVTCDPRLVPEPPGVRLDVAAFVGFANRGPLNVPMPVDDARVFDQLYGPDVELAVDDRDRPVFGHLGSSVRSFFANGGRRCYVVRVAGPSASAARFRLAGIEIASIGAPGSMVDPAPLDLDAATAGVWADAMGVTGEVVAHHMLSETVMDGTIRCRALTATARSEVAVGDLLAVIPPGGTTVRLITVGGVDGTSLSGVRPVAEVNASLVGSRVTSPQVATPSDRWPDGATVLRLRLRLDVDEADRFVVSRVEQIDGLMLGALDGGGAPPVSGNSDSAGAQPWVARIQQHDTVDFDASRSRRLRSPSIAGSVMLMPTDVRLSAAMPITSSLTARGHDGLDRFDPEAMFLDAELSDATVVSLGERIEVQRSGLHRRPTSAIHAIHAIAEVAVVALPDLCHTPWGPRTAPPERSLLEPEVPEPLGFVDCGPEGPCGDLPRTKLRPVVLPANGLAEPFRGAALGPISSVHAALLVLCRSRADLVAVMSLPRGVAAADIADWRAALATEPRLVDSPALSHGGLWHPWALVPETVARDRQLLRPIPPDGVVCGLIAERERTRGVWVSPAGQRLRSAAGRSVNMPSQLEVALFDLGVNLLVDDRGGVTTTSAHSLDHDPDWLQLSVRRLVILLRKIAVLLGERYVFEVDNDRFRAQVRVAFGTVMTQLLERGAIVDFDVVVPPPSNVVGQREGRVEIDLRIAPTSPIEFITVRLTRTGSGVIDVRGG